MDKLGEDSEDWYKTAVNGVDRAATALHDELERTVAALREALQLRETGTDLVQIIHRLNELGGTETRLGPTAAFREFERAVTAYRATVIRTLVVDNGMSFSDVGKLIGVSRQMVARLYRAGAAALEEVSKGGLVR